MACTKCKKKKVEEFPPLEIQENEIQHLSELKRLDFIYNSERSSKYQNEINDLWKIVFNETPPDIRIGRIMFYNRMEKQGLLQLIKKKMI